jgi:hypothetical protein
VIQPKVDGLRRRLDSHNSKIAILLKPLELNLLSDIHRDLADRIDAVHRSVLRLHGLLIPDVEQALHEQARGSLVVLVVPLEIERRFQTSAERIYPETRMPGRFPLQAGADAFMAHFGESTRAFMAVGRFVDERTPQPIQYLSLLKCVWIIRCILQSHELRSVPQSSQWPGYIHQLNEDLSIESQRFTTPSAQQLMTPDLSNIREEEFRIWEAPNLAEFISPHSESFLEEAMKISLPTPSQSLQREMTVYRLERSKYRLVETIEEKGNQLAPPQKFQMDIDLKTVNLTPIYATPSSRQKPLEVLINSPSSQIHPTFHDMKQIFKFQHLLTGYKAYERYDQTMVTVSFFVSGQTAPIIEHGRLQLWLAQPYTSVGSSDASSSSTITPVQKSHTEMNTAIGSVSSNYSREEISPLNPQSPSRGPSPFQQKTSESGRRSATPSSSQASAPVTSSRYSIHSLTSRSRNRTPSVMSNMTNSSSVSRSTVSSMTTVSTGTGRAHLHHKPSKPLLVIFLKSQDVSGKLAIAAIQIDDKTEVKRERCQCRTSNSKCLISCIERSDGFLLAQRWNADQELTSWNLAQVGTEQRRELPANAWNNVKRVSMSFDCLEGRFTRLAVFVVFDVKYIKLTAIHRPI